MIELVLPYPPSANKYWRVVNNRAVKSREARVYIDAVRARYCMVKPMLGEVELTLQFYRPRKAGDLSNRIKVVEDALQGVAYDNDDQVVQLKAWRFDDKANPRVEVKVRPV